MLSFIVLVSLFSGSMDIEQEVVESQALNDSTSLLLLLKNLNQKVDIGGFILIEATYKTFESSNPLEASCFIIQLPDDNASFHDSIISELPKYLHPEHYSYFCFMYTMPVDFWLTKIDALEASSKIVFSKKDPYIELLTNNTPCFCQLEKVIITKVSYMLFDLTSQLPRWYGGVLPYER